MDTYALSTKRWYHLTKAVIALGVYTVAVAAGVGVIVRPALAENAAVQNGAKTAADWTVTIGAISGQTGSIVEVPIGLQRGPSATDAPAAIAFRVLYDPAVLSPRNGTGSDVAAVGNALLGSWYNKALASYAGVSGGINITILGYATEITTYDNQRIGGVPSDQHNPFPLGVLRFSVIGGIGTTSALTVVNLSAANSDALAMAISSTDGSVGTGVPQPVITTDGGNGPGSSYVTSDAAVSLAGTCDSGSTALLVNGSSAGVTYTPGQTTWSYAGVLAEGQNVFSVTAMHNTSVSAATSITVTLVTAASLDVNHDGGVDAVDIQLVTRAALGISKSLFADVNSDGVVNSVDVQLVINGALASDVVGASVPTVSSSYSVQVSSAQAFSGSVVEVPVLLSRAPAATASPAALDLTITYDPLVLTPRNGGIHDAAFAADTRLASWYAKTASVSTTTPGEVNLTVSGGTTEITTYDDQLAGGTPTSQSEPFQVGVLRFTAIGAMGSSSALSVSGLSGANGNGVRLFGMTAQNGNVAVTLTQAPAAWTLGVGTVSTTTGALVEIPISLLRGASATDAPASLSFRVHYDPAVLSPRNGTGNDRAVVNSQLLYSWYCKSIASSTNVAGRIGIVVSGTASEISTFDNQRLVGVPTDQRNPFPVGVLRFDVIGGIGSSSALTVTDMSAANGAAHAMDVAFTAGSASVSVPAPVITTDGGNGPGANYATGESALSLVGTCDSSTTAVLINGSSAGVTYTAGQTTWTYAGILVSGQNVFSATAKHEASESVATTITITLNSAPATVSMSSTAPPVTRLASIPVTVTFSKSVSGFTSEDITPGNATVTDFTGSEASYSFNLAPVGQGVVTADIAAGVAQDSAATGNTAAPQFSRTYDGVAPTVSIGAPSALLTKNGPITYEITYGGADAVTLGYTQVTLNATGTAYATLEVSGTGNTSRTITLSDITGSGVVSISLAADTASDLAGNTADACGPSGAFTVDNTRPTVLLVSPALEPTMVSRIPVTVAFSEPVTGFTAEDIVATNGSVTDFAGAGSFYTFNLAAASPGATSAKVADGVATDLSGNPNQPSDVFTRTYSLVRSTGSIRGVAQDFVTGGRLECVALHIASVAQSVDRVVVVDVNGEYRAPNLPVGDYEVDAYAPGYNNASMVTTVTAGAERTVNFGMHARTMSGGISGHVTDSATGLPLAGIRVDALAGGTFIATAYTCADGEYELVNLVAKSATAITLHFTSHRHEITTQDTSVSPGESKTVSTALPPQLFGSGVVSGAVTNAASHLAIGGARVTLIGDAMDFSVTADSSGAYSFTGLPVGGYVVDASANGFQGQSRTIFITSNQEVADFSLLPGLVAPQLRDIDGDGTVAAVDVQLVINKALDIRIDGDADVNRDGFVNAVDVQQVINAALGVVSE